jgi:predicted AAA+ superfamily ATPase
MFHRILKPSKSSSYFLFGARGTGKTTLLETLFEPQEALFINLLDPEEEDLFIRQPDQLRHRLAPLNEQQRWIVLDEIQRVPRLLDIVHELTQTSRFRFVMTGSSGRKLKRGASNLLAGRAFVYNLFPLVMTELGDRFSLQDTLEWGTLPRVFQFDNDDDRARFLRSYALTYLKEEIVSEQIIRKLDPFRQFLEVAAQSNGKIVNFSKIADDVVVDTKTVISYFSILEETLIGYLLHPFHQSIRKSQRTNPKFYFFDLGIKRALDRTLGLGLQEGTYAYGEAFEHFVVIEIARLCSYLSPDWRCSYLNTKDGAEIDLIIDRPGLPHALIEIKSTANAGERDAANLNRFIGSFSSAEAFCISRDPHEKKIGAVWCLPLNSALQKIGLSNL